MEPYGVPVGIILLLLVTGCAWLLARKANRGVQQFREEQHESFLGRHRHD